MNDAVFPDEQAPEPLVIPHEQLSADALNGVLEEYISREGTDYGLVERDLSSQMDKARQMLASGKVVIVFDQAAERCQIIESRTLEQLRSGELNTISSSNKPSANQSVDSFEPEVDRLSEKKLNDEHYSGD